MTASAFAFTAAQEDRARAALEAVRDAALDYPTFLVEELPPDVDPAAAESWLRELGTVSSTLSELAQGALFEKAHAKIKHVPKAPARRAFLAAAQAARAERRARGEATGEEAKAAARKPEGRLRGFVREAKGSYDRETPTGDRERISSFTLRLVRRVATPKGGPAALECDVEIVDPHPAWDADLGAMKVLTRWLIPAKAWASTRAFRAALPVEGMVWSGTDDDVQGLHEHVIASDPGVPRVTATGVLGRHAVGGGGGVRFVLPGGTLAPGPDGGALATDLVWVPDGGSELADRLPKAIALPLVDDTVRATAAEALGALFRLHEPTALAAVLGWTAACAFAPLLRRALGAAPILHVYGSPGSGKSSLGAGLVWPLAAGVEGLMVGSTQSHFAHLRNFSTSNAIPIFYDELRDDMPAGKREDFQRFLRRSYGGETESRGHADQSLTVFPLVALSAVFGESRIAGDAALGERLVFVGLDGLWVRRASAELRTLFRRITGLPLAAVGRAYQAWTLTADAGALLEAAQADAGAVLEGAGTGAGGAGGLDGGAPPRAHLNLAWVAFGLRAFGAFAAGLGEAVAAAWAPPATEAVLARLVREMVGESEADGAPGDGAGAGDGEGTAGERAPRAAWRPGPTALDHCLADASELAHRGILTEGRDYAWIAGELCLYLPAVESARATAARAEGRHLATPGRTGILRLAQEEGIAHRLKGVVRAWSRAVALDGAGDDQRRVRCLVVDPGAVAPPLGPLTFPRAQDRGWGGTRSDLRGPTGMLDWEAAARRAGATPITKSTGSHFEDR